MFKIEVEKIHHFLKKISKQKKLEGEIFVLSKTFY